jgi:hypothetical protein
MGTLYDGDVDEKKENMKRNAACVTNDIFDVPVGTKALVQLNL